MAYEFRITENRVLEARENYSFPWEVVDTTFVRRMAGSPLQEMVVALASSMKNGRVAAQIHPTLIEVREWVDSLSPAARAAISAHDMKTLDALLDDERLRYRTWE